MTDNQKTQDGTLHIDIRDRTVKSLFGKQKVLLRDIVLSIDPGEMVLVLGGSGAGKTTFINAVTGYEKANAVVKEGDTDVYENYEQMKYQFGFVPQQDLLRGDDNVEMTLLNAAELRMPKRLSSLERNMRVEEVLYLFGLSKLKQHRVDKLSGGQKKRLSVAVEFIADPSIFILDEPDSGLDGVMARDLMEQLREIANESKIVIVITHTPDRCIELFDKVIVLAKDKDETGRLAFEGSIEEARAFFGTDSMERIVKAVNGIREGGDGLADHYIEKFRTYRQAEKEAAHEA